MRPKGPNRLNPKQAKFVEHFIATGNGAQSAKAVGVPKKSAANRASEWLKTPAVKEVVDQARKEVAEKITYTAEVAMRECEDAINFARDTGNANAYVKAVELRSKLQGLLVEKHEVKEARFSINIIKRKKESDDDIFG